MLYIYIIYCTYTSETKFSHEFYMLQFLVDEHKLEVEIWEEMRNMISGILENNNFVLFVKF